MNTISHARLQQLLQKPTTKIVDVRSPVDYNKHKLVADSVNIPVIRANDLSVRFSKKDHLVFINSELDTDLKLMCQYAEILRFDKVSACIINE